MCKVTYNQSGYVGSSMSENAVLAYQDGEMPKSKWTKRAMLDAIYAYAREYDIELPDGIDKMTKADLFFELFEWKSWHHTGKFANETDFYGLNEDAMEHIDETVRIFAGRR